MVLGQGMFMVDISKVSVMTVVFKKKTLLCRMEIVIALTLNKLRLAIPIINV